MREKESGRRIKVNHDARAVIFTEERESETWKELGATVEANHLRLNNPAVNA
jgi:hypothetical protein